MTERETLLAEIAEKQARLAELDATDPLLIEAREICVKYFTNRNYSQTVIDGLCDDDGVVQIALTALRRGMELAERPTLTREMVEGAVREEGGDNSERFIESLYANKLVERIK